MKTVGGLAAPQNIQSHEMLSYFICNLEAVLVYKYLKAILSRIYNIGVLTD